MATITRRTLLAGAAGAGGLALAGCRGPDASDVAVRSGSLRSSHWPGRDIHWQLAQQTKDVTTPAPVVVVLHGKGGDASHAFRIMRLQEHVRSAGVTLASVDGGDYYWHARRAGVDTGAMVVEDFLPLVRRETGYHGRVAFLGWSMGGYGSLLLASELGPDRVFAVVASASGSSLMCRVGTPRAAEISPRDGRRPTQSSPYWRSRKNSSVSRPLRGRA